MNRASSCGACDGNARSISVSAPKSAQGLRGAAAVRALNSARPRAAHTQVQPTIMTSTCLQGWTLLLVGPFVDRAVVGRWVSAYEPSVPAAACLVASCAVAVLVNVSQFMCLGRFSAVTFQARRLSVTAQQQQFPRCLQTKV
jgi:hypothetical protein